MSSGVVRLRTWLAIVAACTIALFAAYVLAQQEARLSADDTPLLAIETAKSALGLGQKPEQFVPESITDVRTSSASFIIITNASHKVLASSIRLDGTTPLPPDGAFDQAKTSQINRFTWEPAGGIRLATVVASYNSTSLGGMYIITGKPLKYAEMRIKSYTFIFITSWLLMIVVSALLLFLAVPSKLSSIVKQPGMPKRKTRRKTPSYVPPKTTVPMATPLSPLADLLDEPEMHPAATIRHKPLPKQPKPLPSTNTYSPPPEPTQPAPKPEYSSDTDPMAGRYRVRNRN